MTVRRVPADFETIQAAVDASGPGDTIRVAGGIYAESVTIGAEKGRLAIIGSGAESTILRGQGAGVGFTISGSSFVTVAGFTVTGFRAGILIQTGDNVIREVTVTGNGAVGITVAQGGPRNLFCAVTANRNGGDGIQISSSTNYVVNSEFHENGQAGIHFIGPGNIAIGNFASGNQTGLSAESIFSAIGNRLVGNQRGLDVTGASGSLLYRNFVGRSARVGANLTGVTDTLVLANEASCNLGAGLRFDAGGGLRVVGNQVGNNGAPGIDLLTGLSVVDENAVRDNDAAGIRLSTGATRNAVRRNELKRNNPDIEAPPADANNVFDGNRCDTSDPDGLCPCAH